MSITRNNGGIRLWFLVLAASLLLAPCLAPAQDTAPKKNVATIWTFWVKPGQNAAFESAIRQHAAWRKQAGESFRWQVYQPVAGDDLAHYVVYSGNHAWSEFDASDKWDADNKADDMFNQQVGPSIERMSHYFASDDDDMSYWPDSATRYPFVEVTDLRFAPGKYGDFRKALGTLRTAAMAQKWSGKWAISSLTGGSYDAVVVFPYANYADMAEKSPSFMDILAKQVGSKEKAGATMDALNSTISDASTTLYRYRPDLSTPAD